MRELDCLPQDAYKLNPHNIAKKSGWVQKFSGGDHKMSDEEFKQYQLNKKVDLDMIQYQRSGEDD